MIWVEYVVDGGEIPGWKSGRRAETRVSEGEEISFRFHLIPAAWMAHGDSLPQKVEQYLHRMGIAEAYGGEGFSFLKTPKADPALAGLLWRECGSREQALLLLPEEEALTEELLKGNYEDLNGLYVLGGDTERTEQMLEAIYEETGLAGVCLQEWTALPERRTVIVDLRKSGDLPWRLLPRQSIYADMDGSAIRERILRVKRPDISLCSVRNYLDTQGKGRYNAICLRKAKKRSVFNELRRK